ncbi:hypothetical protein [Prevotella sp.]|nr:hypothetical protein [Prevotella sp.]
MANKTISQKDKAKMFDFLKDYQDNIKPNFGNYDYLNQEFQKFISTNDIYLGSFSKKCKAKASKHQYFILFEQNKPRNNDNDVIHHLLRHIRNAIAHGRIKREDNIFQLKDYNNHHKTMSGKIDRMLLFDLISVSKKRLLV